MNKISYFTFISLGLVFLPANPAPHKLIYKHQFYSDNNTVSVTQPLVSYSFNILNNTNIKTHFMLDAISAPSRRIFNPLKSVTSNIDTLNLDAISGATSRTIFHIQEVDTNFIVPESENSLSLDAISSASINEKRVEIGGSITQFTKNSEFQLSILKSDENDYQSFSVGISVLRNWLKKNTSTKINYKRYLDKLEPLPQSGRFGQNRVRNIDNLNLEWGQILTKNTTALISYNINLQNWLPGQKQKGNEAMLGRVYYPVLVADTNISNSNSQGGIFFWESFPKKRFGNSGTLKIKQFYHNFINDGSAQLALNRYWGDWGISSYSIDVLLNQYATKFLIIQPRYRFYSQSQAIFYRDRYNMYHINPNSQHYTSYITVDPRLSEFNSHLIDLKLIFYLNKFSFKDSNVLIGMYPIRLDFEIQRYLRSTHSDPNVRLRNYEFYGPEGLKAWIFRSGITFNFN